jgi:mono/diheme cytochrome c family protein
MSRMLFATPCLRWNRAWRIGMCAGTVAWALAVPRSAHPIQAAAPQQQPSALSASSDSPQRALLNQYCVGCHNTRQKAQGATPIALDELDLSNVPAHAEQWEKVIVKLRAGLMPPMGMPRPDRKTIDGLASWVETQIDRAAAANPNPGRTEPLHRLNRAEYQNAVRDLLHLDVDIAALLPADDVSSGFDNIASALTISPTLMDRYLAAAQKVSRLAIGTPTPLPNVDYFRIADDLRQDDHLPGMPFGTRGGTRIPYTFPRDGEYVIRVRLARDMNESMPPYADPQHLEVSLDGERLQVFTLAASTTPGRGQGAAPQAAAAAQKPEAAAGAQPERSTPAAQPEQSVEAPQPQRQRPGAAQAPETVRPAPTARELRNRADQNWDVRVPVKAGEHEITVAFVKKTSAVDETPRLPFLRPYPAGNNVPETRMGAALRSVEISGPHGTGSAGEPPSRRRIFVCTPGGSAASEASCARTILSTVTRRAYRRPVTDADLEPLLALYRDGRAQGGFEAGVERALKRLLVSPEFLYRVEVDPPGARNTVYRVSDLELASRLSFFLWSSIPDDELIDLAVKGRLRAPAVLAAQVKRMLADSRSDALVQNFAGQWLFLRNVPLTGPTPSDFPDFDDTLRQAFRRETELFFESILREDRSTLDLLRADYTFLNERLALHYGIRTIKGSHFRRVTWANDSVRRGLLGHGSILTLTSYPDRTSPVVRGKWILENVLGTPPPPPLPDVGVLNATDGAGILLSMRERLARHRANPACASCHSMLDPLGLALENFDAVGKWRTRDESSQPIDSAAVLPDGTKVVGPEGLRQAILARSDRFVATFTEKLLTYATGRRLEYYDAPAVREILRQAGGNDFRLGSGIILGVVQSTPFQMRKTQR